jgi:hypothetical protein
MSEYSDICEACLFRVRNTCDICEYFSETGVKFCDKCENRVCSGCREAMETSVIKTPDMLYYLKSTNPIQYFCRKCGHCEKCDSVSCSEYWRHLDIDD